MKTTGSVTTLNMELKKPIPVSISSMSINKINILVGSNGSGKSFYMKCVFALSYIAQTIIADRTLNKNFLIIQTQFVFDNCFSNQDIDGQIGVGFECGDSLTVVFENGTVKDFINTSFEKVSQPTLVTYMSSEMRTFNAIHMYLKMRNMIISSLKPNNEQLILEMLKHFKLYDVLYIEGLIVSVPIGISTDLKERLEKFDIKDNIISIGVDLEKSEFYACIDTEENKKSLTNFSTGEQSLINMFINQQ